MTLPPRPKRIGLLGGTSWESTIEYYRLINQRSNALLGGHDTAEVLLYSLNFGDLIRGMEAGSDEFGNRVVECAKGLVKLGAELLAICSNTGHRRAAQPHRCGRPSTWLGGLLRRRAGQNDRLLGVRPLPPTQPSPPPPDTNPATRTAGHRAEAQTAPAQAHCRS